VTNSSGARDSSCRTGSGIQLKKLFLWTPALRRGDELVGRQGIVMPDWFRQPVEKIITLDTGIRRYDERVNP
jgi:hypothetical protein